MHKAGDQSEARKSANRADATEIDPADFQEMIDQGRTGMYKLEAPLHSVDKSPTKTTYT